MHGGVIIPSLDIRYLMGARMDRAIDLMQPQTLLSVCRIINQAGYKRIRVLDCHSSVGLMYLAAMNVLPFTPVSTILRGLGGDVRIVVPDKGAYNRVCELTTTHLMRYQVPLVQCFKERDMATGHLSAFRIEDPSLVKGKECLIIDDICDGGGTFIGLAKELRAAGATSVRLFVTHSIFSRGPVLEGIDQIYTTDSFPTPKGNAITFQVSMKEMS